MSLSSKLHRACYVEGSFVLLRPGKARLANLRPTKNTIRSLLRDNEPLGIDMYLHRDSKSLGDCPCVSHSHAESHASPRQIGELQEHATF